MNHVWSISVAAVFLLTTLPSVAADDPGLTPECDAAVRAAHVYLKANAGRLLLDQAVRYLVERAGEPCGFTLAGALPGHADPAALTQLVTELNEGNPSAPRPAMTSAGGDDPLGLLAALVPCKVPGGGFGTIEAFVLGIGLHHVTNPTAEGEWSSVSGYQVAGSNGLWGGVQPADGPGIIEIGPLFIPADQGSVDGTCKEVVTEVGRSTTCYGVPPFWYHCEETITFKTTLIPCGATANQRSLLGLMSLSHSYTTDAEGC